YLAAAVRVTAANDITVQNSGLSNYSYGSEPADIALTSTGGQITISGYMNAGRNITLSAPGPINVQQSLYPANYSSGSVSLTSSSSTGGITTSGSGSISVNRDVTLQADGAISVGASISNYSGAAGNFSLTSTSSTISTTSSGSLNAPGDIALLASG